MDHYLSEPIDQTLQRFRQVVDAEARRRSISSTYAERNSEFAARWLSDASRLSPVQRHPDHPMDDFPRTAPQRVIIRERTSRLSAVLAAAAFLMSLATLVITLLKL